MALKELVVKVKGDDADFKRSMKGVSSATEKVGKDATKLSGTFKELGSAMAGMFAISSLTAFAGSIITIRSEFEKYEAVLSNSLGSHRLAAEAMEMLKDFATQTPFQLTELTDAYVKLVNRGLRPSTAELTKLGDFASATGKSFGQLNEAIMDANNPERWKEFGVRTQTIGDKVRLTFKNTTVEVENTAAGVMKAVEAFGAMEGVAGTMTAQMDTLGGKVSNLKDAWDQLLNTLGETSIWADVMSAAAQALSGITTLAKGGSKSIQEQKEIADKTNDYVKRLEEAIKKTGNLEDAQKLLEDQSQAAMNELIKLEKQRDVIRDGTLSPKQKIDIIGEDAWKKAKEIDKSIKYIRSVYDATMEYVKNNKLVDEIFGKKDAKQNIVIQPPKQRESLPGLSAIQGNTNFQIPQTNQIEPLIGLVDQLTVSWQSFGDTVERLDISGKFKDFVQITIDIGKELEYLAEGAVISFAESIGSAFSGNGGLKAGLDSILLMFADWAGNLGKIIIASAIAIDGIKNFALANPWAAVALGVALVATAAAIKGAVGQKPVGKGGGGGGSSSQNQDWDAFGLRGIRGMTVEVNGVLKAQGKDLVAVITSENNRKGL